MADVDREGGFKLRPDQKQNLEQMGKRIETVQRQIAKLEKLGLDATRLKDLLQGAEDMRKGLLEQFGQE